MDKKKCSSCAVEKDLVEFHPNKTKADGLQTTCKTCRSSYNRDYYKKHKEGFVARAKVTNVKLRQRNALLYKEIKDKPCMDCGQVFHPWCMEFDHARGEKSFGIAGAIGWKSWEKILAEIKKCDLVCANCHRMRTHKRKFEDVYVSQLVEDCG
jgi:hypothetical protein